MPDLRPVFFVVGLMIAALGVSMFAPMAVFARKRGFSPDCAQLGRFVRICGCTLPNGSHEIEPNRRAI